MKTFLKYFWFDVVFAMLSYGFLLWFTGNSLDALQTAVTLTVLELLLSFDNAVITADKVSSMNSFWRKMFLTVGILFAVVFVRFTLPLLLVSWFGDVSLSNSLDIALHHHEQFKVIIHAAHPMIAGFAGVFLALLSLEFFMDTEKENHWLSFIEIPLFKLGITFDDCIGTIWVTSFAVLVISYFLSADLNNGSIFTGACFGAVTFIVLSFIKNFMESLDEKLKDSKMKWLTGGLSAFLICEALDLAMSADSVVTAIALSGDVVVIVCGLAVSSLAVRSLTLKLVDDNTLETLPYLENAAFLSIFVLAISMFVGLFVDVPEWFIGAVSLTLLSFSVYSSLKLKNKVAI